MKPDDLLAGLPGEDLLRGGLADFQSNRCTIAACLVHIARPHLTQAGLLPLNVSVFLEPELQLYQLLQQEKDAAYSRYNTSLCELISFEMVLDHRMRRRQGARVTE